MNNKKTLLTLLIVIVAIFSLFISSFSGEKILNLFGYFKKNTFIDYEGLRFNLNKQWYYKIDNNSLYLFFIKDLNNKVVFSKKSISFDELTENYKNIMEINQNFEYRGIKEINFGDLKAKGISFVHNDEYYDFFISPIKNLVFTVGCKKDFYKNINKLLSNITVK